MTTLHGTRVALLEGRMSGELASLVLRHGGEPLCVPAVREAARSCAPEVNWLIDQVGANAIELLICSTGAGVNALIEEAEQLGQRDELIRALDQITSACRGPKPAAAFKRHGLSPAITTVAPHTTTELLAALDPIDLRGAGVALLHYGERNAPLAGALHARGARLAELCVYEWLLPDDLTPLGNLIEALICNRIDAIAFTAQVQLRHLLHVAAAMGVTNNLIDALNHETIVAAVGPTCAAALEQAGIVPDVVPTHPKMGQMIGALAAYITNEIARGRRPALLALEPVA
jgi:uroporphyrinogen-III synthase